MFKYTKRGEMNPQKNKHMKMVQTFSLLWDSIPRSHKKKKKAPPSVQSRMGGKKKKCGIVYPLLLKLEDQMVCPYTIQTASNCVALKAAVVHTNPQKDAVTNSRKKKHGHLCPRIAGANWTQQKVCKSHSSDRNLIQCFQCIPVSIKLFLRMPCRHSGEWRFSSTHTLNFSTTVNGQEWSASCQATPCPLKRRLDGNQNWHGHCGVKKNIFPCQESN